VITGASVAESRSRSRVLTAVGAGAVLVLVAGIAGAQLLPSRSSSAAGAAKPVKVQTAQVTRTDLATTTSLPGQLGYGTEHAVKAGADGEVTWLPKVGRTLTRGQQVFRVDDQPVVLFYGRTPLFRSLDRTGLVGRDVRMVADNLQALGYSIGYQPGVGTLVRQPGDPSASTPSNPPNTATTTSKSDDSTGSSKNDDTTTPAGAASTSPAATAAAPVTRIEVRPGDAVLTTSLRAAIRRWQGRIGATRTGILEVGSVLVQPAKIRVSSVTAQLGDSADAPLISVTGTGKVVTVSIEATEMESIRGAKKVTVTLPTGTSAAGRVSSLSRVVAVPDGQDTTPSSTATIVLNRLATVRHLDSAPVQVQFTAEARKHVLAVPVGALLALSEGGYAVQVPGGPLLPVTVGLFAKGLVQVRGAGISAGTTVVTTS
jgi:hypothetical protein